MFSVYILIPTVKLLDELAAGKLNPTPNIVPVCVPYPNMPASPAKLMLYTGMYTTPNSVGIKA